MNHAKTSFSTEIFAGAIISMVQYFAPLRYVNYMRRPIPFYVLLIWCRAQCSIHWTVSIVAQKNVHAVIAHPPNMAPRDARTARALQGLHIKFERFAWKVCLSTCYRALLRRGSLRVRYSMCRVSSDHVSRSRPRASLYDLIKLSSTNNNNIMKYKTLGEAFAQTCWGAP
jgi:hypothetical protein